METETQNEDSSKQERTGEKESVQNENPKKQTLSSPRGFNPDNRKRKYNMDKFNKDRKRNKFDVGKRLSEVDIGATEFISDYSGFSGIVKDRYSDFHVHEIAKDGTVSKLTTFELPNFNGPTLTVDEMMNSIPEDIREKMQAFLDSSADDARVSINVTECDKDLRRTIHQISKSVPGVISQTEEKDGQKMLIISKKKNKNFFKFNRRDDRIDWSNCDGDYLYFILHKVNMDTMDALNQLARSLRINVSVLNYAGTKDRRAKTSQWVSWKRGNPRLVESAARRMRNAYCGNFKTAKEPQKLGMLKGNQFTIALRNVSADNETIDLVMTSLRDHGFINYFGLQRFGSIASIPTYEIGKNLLQGNWKNAVDLILKPRDEEQDENLAEARKIYEETKNAKKAFAFIERSDKIEARLLRGIDICGDTNFQGALDHIPKNTLLMYIHSYQSLVWNTIVSRRIREFGKKPVIGDLVYADVVEETEESDETNENDKEIGTEPEEKKGTLKEDDEAHINEDGDIIKNGGDSLDNKEKKTSENVKAEDDALEGVELEKNDKVKEVEIENKSEEKKVEDQRDSDDRKLPGVKALTEGDLEKYTLADVIMPLPGYRVTYPSYGKAWYDEMIEKDGLNTDLKHLKNKKYSLSGSYRKILRLPLDLSWQIKHYDDRNTELILSDLDEMRKIELPEEKPDAKFKALIIKMSLQSSTYATCALREIMKQDMSSQTQAAKSAAH